jgi:hypothetical protein
MLLKPRPTVSSFLFGAAALPWVACGSPPNNREAVASAPEDAGSTFSPSAGDAGASGAPSGSPSGASADAGLIGTFGDGSVSTTPEGCTAQQCKAVNCAAMGLPETALKGTVRDPAGALPLYNVYVYVPNGTPAAISPGNPTCTQCQALASGSPMLGQLTGPDGKFTLRKGASDRYGVPVGTSIPLVLQVGKWRRQVVIPRVAACQTTDLDVVLGPDQLRLPKKSSEGDMPIIALTSGSFDAFECFLRVVGIDDSEFVPPSSPTGHVHFYTGADLDPTVPASSIAGGNTVADTFRWWTSAANLLKYDIILNGCDGINGTRPAAAYAAMATYLNSGGRVFATDSFEDWFQPPTGARPLQTVADWQLWLCGSSYMNYFADTSFPKGQAFGQWLLANGVASTGAGGTQINLTDTYADVNGSGPTMYPGSTRWIFNADRAGNASWSTSYLSFNTPVGLSADKQCGRGVFSGVHVFSPANSDQFPAECQNPNPAYEINQKALEFLFFDLSSCVQDDQQPPPQPPPMTQ